MASEAARGPVVKSRLLETVREVCPPGAEAISRGCGSWHPGIKGSFTEVDTLNSLRKIEHIQGTRWLR